MLSLQQFYKLLLDLFYFKALYSLNLFSPNLGEFLFVYLFVCDMHPCIA